MDGPLQIPPTHIMRDTCRIEGAQHHCCAGMVFHPIIYYSIHLISPLHHHPVVRAVSGSQPASPGLEVDVAGSNCRLSVQEQAGGLNIPNMPCQNIPRLKHSWSPRIRTAKGCAMRCIVQRESNELLLARLNHELSSVLEP